MWRDGIHFRPVHSFLTRLMPLILSLFYTTQLKVASIDQFAGLNWILTLIGKSWKTHPKFFLKLSFSGSSRRPFHWKIHPTQFDVCNSDELTDFDTPMDDLMEHLVRQVQDCIEFKYCWTSLNMNFISRIWFLFRDFRFNHSMCCSNVKFLKLEYFNNTSCVNMKTRLNM